MKSRAFYLLMLCCCISVCNLYPLIHPRNGLNECRKNSPLTALEVLPGGGWDNLRNIDMGRVMNLSYCQCQTTEDGVYLIPDEVFVIPQKVSRMETNSEIIMSWLNQTSSTSSSINADGHFSSAINGKYSEENQRIKTHQVKDKSVTSWVQVRNHLYTVKAYPHFSLDSRFAQQAEEIANAIEANKTHLAIYLSEKLILDYGTHVITSVDAGASLVQEDYLKKSFMLSSQSDISSLSALAGFKFFDDLQINISRHKSQESSEIREYKSNITYSLTQSNGGALFYPGITLQKWQESTLNNLVAIDRSGLPLHYFLNPSKFSDIPAPTINKLALLVYEATQQYYKINTIPGCLNPDSEKFNFQANIDDESCDGPDTSFSFGGIYQKCTPLTYGEAICDETAQRNPATGDYSCPQQYNTTLLHSEIVERGSNNLDCNTYCENCGFLWSNTCCHQTCSYVYYIHHAQVDTYWCSSIQKIPEYPGYLFGGLFGPSLQNPLTKSNSCPPNYIAQKFLSNDMMVCLSNDYVTATKFSSPFGGFFSCKSGNPLAKGKFHCPPQFSQHLAAVSDGCQVLYCVDSSKFTNGNLKPVHLPPFTSPPMVSMIATNTVAVMTEGDHSWVRDGESKMWRLAKPGEINLSSSHMSGGEKAGIAVGVIILIAGAMLLMKRRQYYCLRDSRRYQEL